MTGAEFVGLTWDHPRGRDALMAAAQKVNAGREQPLIEWKLQPLEGFESAPIGELAAAYDILVLDHPHIGEAVALGALQPVDVLFGGEAMTAWDAQSVGAALTSYVWERETFALPLDVASQVMALRRDRLDPPDTWDDVLGLLYRCKVAPSLAGPHAFLTLVSIAASLGSNVGGPALLDDAPALEALAMLQALHNAAPAGTETLNPIALLEALSEDGGPELLPLVFGYVNYCGRSGVGFAEAPAGPSGARGSVLGGTGLAFTARAKPSRELLEHVAWLMAETTQRGFVPQNAGQPSARSAWIDDNVNRDAHGFYRSTLETVDHALVRPRFDGFIAFQTEAAAKIRCALEDGAAPAATLKTLRDRWTGARNKAKGPLDDTRPIPSTDAKRQPS